MSQPILQLFLIGLLSYSYPSLAQRTEQAPQKKALLIAINDYPNQTGWTKTHALNDVELIKCALLDQDFAEKNILILAQQSATKAGIISAFKTHFENLRAGDFALFHFSGHGQQITDRNNDELDGLDEALIPYDAQMKESENYKGHNHLLDDELELLFYELRSKLTPKGQLMALIDACHSGTISRGQGIARGTTQIFGTTTKSGKPDINFISNASDEQIAPLILFSATSQDELNYEFWSKEQKYYGPLSYAFATHFPYIKKATTYATFFDNIRLSMAENATNQVPHWEGNLNRTIWRNQFKGKAKYYKVTEVNGADYVKINGGILTKLTQGTTIDFYPADTWHTKNIKPLVSGTIEQSYPFYAWVKLDNRVSLNLMTTWGIIRRQNFGNLSLPLQLAFSNEKLGQQLKKELGEIPAFVLQAKQPTIFIKEHRGLLTIVSANNILLFNQRINLYNTNVLISEIINDVLFPYLQAMHLRQIPFKNEHYAVSLEMVPVLASASPYNAEQLEIDRRLPLDKKKDTQGNVVFKTGDYFQIKVKNNGTANAYFAILDIQPDNKINVFIPEKGRHPTEYFLEKGTEKILKGIWQIGKPLGKEVFKLIASDQPMNWRTLDQFRGESATDFLGIPDLQLEKEGERGHITIKGNPSAANIETFIFQIVEGM